MKINDRLPLLSFLLDVTIRQEHYNYSEAISSEDGCIAEVGDEALAIAARSLWVRIQKHDGTLYRIPATKAIAEALQSVGISYDQIIVITNSEKGTYFIVSRIFDKKDWTFKADYPYSTRLLTAIENQQNYTFTLDFQVVSCSSYERVSPVKPLWQSMIINYLKLACALIAMEGFFMTLGSKVSLKEIRNILLYALAGTLVSPLIAPIAASRSLKEDLYKLLQKGMGRFT